MMQRSDRGSTTKLIRPPLAKKWIVNLRSNVGSLYPSKVKSYANFHNKKVNMLIYCLYISCYIARDPN